MSTSAGTLQRGIARYRRGAHVEALHALARHVDAHPRSAEGWLWVARARFRLHEVDGALAACGCALAIVAEYAAALDLRERIAAGQPMAPAPAKQGIELGPEAFELVAALIGLIVSS
jgi:hypothetical protein